MYLTMNLQRKLGKANMQQYSRVIDEMLTGRVPFLSRDPLELIHSHLAEEALPVIKINREIPSPLSSIIGKLLQKEPEKRYQSSASLLFDLKHCREEYLTTGTIQEFPLEQGFRSQRVTFISKMVGRDKEAEIILEEYEQAAQGQFRSLFISGLSGIGKTRLIQELQAPIVRHRGYFTSGKFDVYEKNIPYSSLIQAFRNLLRTILTESDERVAHWKSTILAAVGKKGKVLTDVIPELEILIGPQPEVPELPPAESLNRFHDLFDRFLGCVATKENPLTLFIDDLQWCDSASFDFLTYVFANHSEHPYLFFLGAYRYNEVDSSHPLSKLIDSAKEKKQPLREIRLEPLKPEHSHEMVSYILDSPLSKTKTLSDFISSLSQGNPLFVTESISYLYNEDLLYFDEEGQWCWDLDKIHQSRMPTTVVALFNSKIKNLAPELRDLLEYCACMGNTFSPAVLAAVKNISLPKVFEALKPALSQGLLIDSKGQLQFIHDKVQEAVLFDIPKDSRRKIHWRIGTYLLEAAPKALTDPEKVDNLFTIVSHLNLGKNEEIDDKTAYLLSDLNYLAGRKALNSLAVEAANAYFYNSRKLLPGDCWEDPHYERTFRIYKKAAKTELMCGNYSTSEALLNTLLQHAKTDLDKAECLAEQTTSLSSIGNFKKAIETANKGLAYFGKSIPDNPIEANRKRKKLVEDIASKGTDIFQKILDMPFTTDRKSKVELAFYSELIPDLYASGLVPQLYMSAAQSTRHCLSGGMDESVIYSFTIMGLQLGEQGEFDLAFKYEDLARELSAKYPNTFGATRGMNGIVWCNMHSRSHPRDIVDYCLKAIQCGRNCGDLYNAGLSYGPLMWNLQVQGADFTAIENYAQECLQFSRKYHLSFSVGLAEAMQAGWIAPMKKRYVPVPMTEKLKKWERDNHIASAGSYYINLALTHYYLGEHTEAEKYLSGARKYLTGLTDNVLKRQWHVFVVLNALRLYEKGAGCRNKDVLMKKVRPFIKKVEKWAKLGPLLKPYLALLYAELERATGGFERAVVLYMDAIDMAHQQGYTFLEGHLYECLGEILHQAGRSTAGTYFTEAVRLYRKCSAGRKEINLLEKYTDYFAQEKALDLQPDAVSPQGMLPDLNAEYLMKSSMAISAEIEQEALIKKIMNVVIESSGAQNGYLIMREDGDLFIRGVSRISDKQAVQRVKIKLDEAKDICREIVRYVYRTGEKVILNDASNEGLFKNNPEVQKMQLRSVFCLPVVKQSKIIGIVYLDNCLSDSVFTPEKTQMTELLVSQAAISLDNARLVEKMKKTEMELLRVKDQLEVRVRERTAELAKANELLEKDIEKRKLAEKKVKAERQRFYAVLEKLPCYLILMTPDYRVAFANRVFRELFGESGGKRCYEHLFGASEPCKNCGAFVVLETNEPNEWEWTGPNGRTYFVYDFPFTDVDGSTLILEMGIDMTERKKAEAEIQKLNRELEERVQKRTAELAEANKELQASEAGLQEALYEKELLLREIHHRVKNNLQVIHSILNLQAPYIKDEQDRELFKESQNRVFSMALIHEKLYQSESLAHIDLLGYIQSLTSNLFHSYGVSEYMIRPVISVENITLNMDTVIPCALIIKELVTNSLKHAFPDRDQWQGVQAGEIYINLRRSRGKELILTVGDNGIGLPEGFDINKTESLGLKLVNVLVKQLKGVIKLKRSKGTEFTISFTKQKRKERM